MATQKKAAKPAAKKPVPKKVVVAKTVKKAAPVKKQVKPVPKKATKPVIKKAVAKPVANKTTPKPTAKKVVAKPLAKKIAKPLNRQVSRPVDKAVAKKVAAPEKSSQSVAKAVPKKPVTASKPTPQPMTKKTEEKKATTKIAAASAPVTGKAPAKAAKDIKVAPPKPVVIPKTNTKTVRKYQPDFTKSVLDQPKNDPGASIIRYNDNDLTEFRELIQRKLGAAKKELSYLQGLITRKDELGGDESDNRYMTMEDGSLSMEREQLSQMASRQITFIDHLEKALMRIENKTYGICRVTGKLIDKARLRAVPHATLSIEAKMGQK